MPIIKFSEGKEESSSPSLPVQSAPQSLHRPGSPAVASLRGGMYLERAVTAL